MTGRRPRVVAAVLAGVLSAGAASAQTAGPCALGSDPRTDAAHQAWSEACVGAVLGADAAGRDALLHTLLRSSYPLTGPQRARLVERLGASDAAPLAAWAYLYRFGGVPPDGAAPPPLDALSRRADRAGDDLAAAYFILAQAKRDLLGGRTDSARARAEEVLARADRAGAAFVAPNALNVLAAASRRTGDHAEALRQYGRALAALDSLGRGRHAAIVMVNAGILFRDFGDYETAEATFARAVRALEGYGAVGRRSLVGALSNQGVALALMGEHRAAVPVFERSLGVGRGEGRLDVEGYTTFHLAKSRYALGERGGALALADRGARLAGEHNDPAAAAPMWTWLAARYLDAGRTGDALSALDEARALMEVGDAGPQALLGGEDQGAWAHEYARGMAEVLARTDRPAQALDYALVALELGDRRLETERLQALADLEALGDLRESEQRREIAAREAALAQARLGRQRALLAGGGVGFLLLSALALALYRTSRVRRRANALLTEKNAEIERQRAEVEAALVRTERLLGEREVLLREVHHRVKNNLQVVASLVNLQSDAVADDEARAALRQMRARVEAMALVHRRLYGGDDLRTVDAADYLGDLARLLGGTYAWVGAELDAELDSVALDADTAVPLGLATAELVANAFEHGVSAGGGRVRLSLTRVPGGRLVLAVEDDGPGLPPGTAAPPDGSLGLQLASDLALQLGGRLEMGRSQALGGARLAIDVPHGGDGDGAAVRDGAAVPVPQADPA